MKLKNKNMKLKNKKSETQNKKWNSNIQASYGAPSRIKYVASYCGRHRRKRYVARVLFHMKT